jgi:dynein heavy chain
MLCVVQDNMDDALLKKINKSTSLPGFNAEAVGKVSVAAKGMCLWVRAMEVYGTIAKDVAPKRARLKAAQDNVAKKKAALIAAQTQLEAVLAKVKALRDK